MQCSDNSINIQPSVAVIMSTYNGEKYLREQIDSILGQENVDISLFIRDDGSSDHTEQIINEYIKSGENRIYYTAGENCGPGSSFMRQLYATPDTFDYYAYSDQDDVWLSNKMIRAINALQKNDKQLYMSNLMCIDQDGKQLGLRNEHIPDTSPYAIMNSNETNGCTMVFSRSFFQKIVDEHKRPDEVLFTARCHDTWAAMIGTLANTFYYDFQYSMLYRQHENNVIGATNVNHKSARRVLWRKIREKNKRNGRSKLAAEVNRCFPELLKDYPYIQRCAEPGRFKNKLYLISHYNMIKSHGAQAFAPYAIYVLMGLI